MLLANDHSNQNSSAINGLPSKLQLTGPIAIVGAGGKTHLAFWLALQFKMQGLAVCITTTTKMYYPHQSEIDNLIQVDRLSKVNKTQQTQQGHIDFIYRHKLSCPDPARDKISGFSPVDIDELYHRDCYDVIIVEADGAKQRPLKAPAGHEPCIPSSSSLVFGVTGADAFFVPTSEALIHRYDLFSQLTGCGVGGTCDETAIVNLITKKDGLFKGTPNGAQKIWVINKLDTVSDRQRLSKLIENVLAETESTHIWTTILHDKNALKGVFKS